MKVLMCPPAYYGIEYEINPWMSLKRQPDHDKAWEQWKNLKKIYEGLGIEVLTITPIRGLPDMVFTANAGSVCGKKIILSKFRHKERRGEIPHFQKFFLGLGYETRRLEILIGKKGKGKFFEGHGDLLSWGKEFIGGYGEIRSTKAGVLAASRFLGKEPILLRLVSKDFYHLDTCFCPGKWAFYYPGAFDDASWERLDKNPFTYGVSAEDANRFVCNGIQLEIGGRWYFIAPEPTKELRDFLKKNDIELIPVDVSEFILSGGGPRCLAMFL